MENRITQLEELRRKGATAAALAHYSYSGEFPPWILSQDSPAPYIRSEVASHFNCSVENVHFVGSAHFGISLQTGADFQFGVSDLDLGIVNTARFRQIRSNADGRQGWAYWNAGLCRPDKVSNFDGKEEWVDLASHLSDKFREYFSEISFTLYESFPAFLNKQAAGLQAFNAGGGYARGTLVTSQSGSDGLIEAAASLGFPLHLVPIERSRPENSSPYVVGLEEVFSRLGTSQKRISIIKRTRKLLDQLSAVIQPEALMIGGSFLDTTNSAPSDIDMVIFYSMKSEAVGLEQLKFITAARNEAKKQGIDCRLAPTDVDPMIPLQMASFFTGLYSSTRTNGVRRPGVLLVPMNETRRIKRGE